MKVAFRFYIKLIANFTYLYRYCFINVSKKNVLKFVISLGYDWALFYNCYLLNFLINIYVPNYVTMVLLNILMCIILF